MQADPLAEYGPPIKPICSTDGHAWRHMGGKNCGCLGGHGRCSIPVHRCDVCGDWDYGENDDAERTRFACASERAWRE